MTTLKLLFKINSIIALLIIMPFNNARYSNSFNSQTEQKDTIIKVKKHIVVGKNIQIKNYFQFIDSIVSHSDSLTNYQLTEHLLIRFNPWIIENLINTDYYKMMKKDTFVYNQKDLTVLKKGDEIYIPDDNSAKKLLNSFENTHISINIPEYKLRIFEDSLKLFEFPIRVGKNEKKYLKMAKTVVDLKTKTGNGIIVNHVKNPDFYNPVNNHKYYLTLRDDNKTTKMPQIPWIETEINGIRNGQLIHPTTNPNTLNKAYSNGCIGTKEADAWVIYYYAPIGTKIAIKYQLLITTNEGKEIMLNDVYDSASHN